jgi:putative transposase
MRFEENKVYHVYNRGNNKQKIFFNDRNYKFFLKKLQKELAAHCELLNYCLMPNHFHLIVYVKCKISPNTNGKMKTLNDGIAILLRSYTRALQIQENFTGSLFQQKTKAKELIEECDLIACSQYIHNNPLKAGLVKSLDQWPYSSYTHPMT